MTEPLFPVTDVDREVYEARLRDFLPARLIDIHTHTYRYEDLVRPDAEVPGLVTWPWLVARDNPMEDHRETYRLMFPAKEVSALIFGTINEPDGLADMNAYTAEVSQATGWPALVFAHPSWTGQVFEEQVEAGGFVGAKVYLSSAPKDIPRSEIRIFDFIPRHQLEVLNRRGWVLMLHIPRNDRLRDPENVRQMIEMEERYPNVRVIIAHVGRAYCMQDVGDALDTLAERTARMHFDISANTNERVFAKLIDTVGPGRILFGSDLPVARMRMRRECVDGVYVNVVPRGLYGDVSDDPHMREVDPPEADRLTFFMYEIIDAFRRAAEATGLSRDDIRGVFHDNAAALLERVGDWNVSPM